MKYVRWWWWWWWTCSVQAHESSSISGRCVPTTRLVRHGGRQQCRWHAAHLLRRRRRRVRRRQTATAHAPSMRSAACPPDVRRDARVRAPSGSRWRRVDGDASDEWTVCMRRTRVHLPPGATPVTAHRTLFTAVLGNKSLAQRLANIKTVSRRTAQGNSCNS